MTEEKKSNADLVVVELSSNTTIGQKLAQAREALGLSIGEVAERLKLSARQIEALEQDDYTNLPEPVFVRGFLRSYARFLNLDEASIVADLDTALPKLEDESKTESSIKVSKKTQPHKAPTKISPKLIIAVLIILIVGAVLAFQFKLFDSSSSKIGTSNVAVGELVSPDTINTDNNLLASSDVDGLEQSGVASQENIPPQDALALEAGLKITVGYRTSLKVLDANGNELINQIVPGKSEHKIEGIAPFTVRIGYAKGTAVQYNNQAIDIASDIQNNTVEFIVPKQP